MRGLKNITGRVITSLVGGLFMAGSAFAVPVSLNLAGSFYAQNFDSLATSGASIAWANESTLEGWSLFNSSGAAPATYSAGTGSSSTGAFYSFGSTSTSDRALGGLGVGAYFGSPASGAIAGWIAVSFLNDLSGSVSSFTAGWNGEQWRNGGNTSAQSMIFEYGFGNSFASVASWTVPGGSFNWTSPVVASTPAAVDGNSAGRVEGLGGEIGNLNWAVGDTLWLRWVERNDAGNDHGLAIDDFSLNWQVQTPVNPGPTSGVPDAGASLALFGLSLTGLSLLARRRS